MSDGLEKFLSKHNNVRLNKEDPNSLEGRLTMEEINTSLKSMRNQKSPGIDGFPAEFFKGFWIKLKFFVLRALNNSYETGEMSVSLRQCIITCLPKGDKPKQFLKNWRPILLLSAVYKISISQSTEKGFGQNYLVFTNWFYIWKIHW